jgi:hypothetical protein
MWLFQPWPPEERRIPSVQGALSLKLASRPSAAASKMPMPSPDAGGMYSRLGMAHMAVPSTGRRPTGGY